MTAVVIDLDSIGPGTSGMSGPTSVPTFASRIASSTIPYPRTLEASSIESSK